MRRLVDRTYSEAHHARALREYSTHASGVNIVTFRSLYRLEQRGLLKCPILGVAVNDWTVEQLREHARQCIIGTGEQLDPHVFDRFAARLSYLSGDFADTGTYQRLGQAMTG